MSSPKRWGGTAGADRVHPEMAADHYSVRLAGD
jgi:hypothetical protein